MSRERFYIYKVPRTDESLEKWDKFFESTNHKGIMAEAICQGGGADETDVDHWIYCNKTKAKYVSRNLNSYYGVKGQLFEGVYDKETDDLVDIPVEY